MAGSVESIKAINFKPKVYDEPSIYGIDGGRVSKLIILKKDAPDWSLSNALFNYDRGIDIDHKIGHELASLFKSGCLQKGLYE